MTAPEVTEGPYYINNEIVRNDLSEKQGCVLSIIQALLYIELDVLAASRLSSISGSLTLTPVSLSQTRSLNFGPVSPSSANRMHCLTHSTASQRHWCLWWLSCDARRGPDQARRRRHCAGPRRAPGRRRWRLAGARSQRDFPTRRVLHKRRRRRRDHHDLHRFLPGRSRFFFLVCAATNFVGCVGPRAAYPHDGPP